MTNGSKYRQVEQYIIKEIEKGNLKTGDQIMTEEQLCEKFGFSRMTVNKALNRLSESGYITRTPGKGSFVSTPQVRKTTGDHQSFTNDMERIGLKAGSSLISYEADVAAKYPKAKKMLGLNDDDFVHYFIRLRTGNGKPIAVSYTYISAKIIPAIDISCLSKSFYAYLDQIGITRDRTDMEIRAVLPDKEKKELLHIDHSALLLSSHVTYTLIDQVLKPFEYIETYYNGDMYTYTTEI